MARYIKEYSVRIEEGETQLLLDEGAEILGVALKYSPTWLEDVVAFWAFCEDGVPPGAPRTFQVVGTDRPVPEGAVHHGVVRVLSPGYALHLVELAA